MCQEKWHDILWLDQCVDGEGIGKETVNTMQLWLILKLTWLVFSYQSMSS